MPPRPPAPGVVKMEMLYTLSDGQPMANVMHAQLAGDFADATKLQATSEEAYNEWASTTFSNCAAAVQLAAVRLTDLSSLSGAQVVHSGAATGGDAGVVSDAGRSLVVTVRSAERSRSGRGRIYLPPMRDSHVADPRHWNSAWADAIVTSVEAFSAHMAGLSTSTFEPLQLGVLSYFHNGILRADPQFHPAVSFTADTRLDSQRRRLGR